MKAVLFLTLLITLSCSHATKKITNNVSFAEASQRESTDLKEFTVKNKDNSLEFKTKAVAQPIVTMNMERVPFNYSSINIGSQAPIECFFYASDISPAAALQTITNQLLDEKAVGKIVDRKTSYLTAAVMEESPVLMLQTSFKIDEDGKQMFGNLKTIMGVKEIGNVICAHNEVGYQETFLAVFKDILSSMNYLKLPQVETKYKGITVFTLKNVPIGFVVEYLGEAQPKTSSWVEKASFLIPTDDTNVVSLDDLTVEIANEQGKISYGLYKSEENAVAKFMLEISSTDHTTYLIKGMNQNQPVHKSLMFKEGLYSHSEITKLIAKKFFKQSTKSFSVPVYIPDQSLFSPTKISLKLEKMNAVGGIVQLTDGKQTHHAVVSKDGTEEAVTFNFGEIQIEGKRVFKKGAYPQR